MKLTLRMILLLALGLLLVTSAFAQDEIGIGDSIEDEADGDDVEYEVELEEGQTVTISLESDDFDTRLFLYNEDGDEVAENDDVDLAAGNTNSEIEYEVEDSGTHTILVTAFGGGPEGDFELSVDGDAASDEEDEEMDEEDEEDSGSSGDVDLEYDEELEVDLDDLDNPDELELTFEGAEDDVVTILVRSEAEQNVKIELLDPDGDDIAVVDEFNFGEAALLRIELPDDGVYTIVIEERDGEDLEDDYEIEVLETELLDLGEGAQSTELDSSYSADVMFFEAEEDEVYSIYVQLDGNISSSLNVEVCEEDPEDCFFADVSFSVSGVEEALFFFEASDDGVVTLKLDTFIFSSDELEVTIEVGQE